MSSAGGETQQKAAKVVPKSNREHGVAGSIAAAVAVLVLHPMDVLKVRLQGIDDDDDECLSAQLNNNVLLGSARRVACGGARALQRRD